MTIRKFKDEKEENPPPLFDAEVSSKPRRIALFVEPSPFAYISGYKNRFQNFIKYVREMGDEITLQKSSIIAHSNRLNHTSYAGPGCDNTRRSARGVSRSSVDWLKKNVPLSLALSPGIISAVSQFKLDIIHASSPSIMVFGALAIAKFLISSLVMYHTHVPVMSAQSADLTLVPSAAIAKDLVEAKVTTANMIRIWNMGVDSESFHPRFRSHDMRLSNGEPDRPLIVHVGRLGVEKSLDFLKRVMDELPEARIEFVGDGPYR